jgi:outer membrane lipoprotein-sorting protein
VGRILKQVAATYQAAKDYELVTEQSESGMKMRIQVAFRSPDRYLLQVKRMDLDPPQIALLTVGNDAGFWNYLGEGNIYMVAPPGPPPAELQKLFTDGALATYRDAGKYVEGATFLREEAAAIGNAKIDCYVITVSVPTQGPSTWWIAKENFHVVREEVKGEPHVMLTVRLNEPLADEMFRFTPPPGAKKAGEQ